MTKASAFRRTTAARLLARFPLVADYLADGRLNLTTLVELRDVLDEAHLVEILDRAAGRTEDQVKELVASLRPQPAPADLLRRLPSPRNDSGGSGPVPAAANCPSAPLALPPPFLPPPVPAPATAVQVARPPAARLHPIAPEQHVLRVTVSAEFVANLEAARRALSHKLPGGELAEVLHEGLRAILANADRRRRGTGKKSTASMPPPGSRYVPAAVRDEVWRRDGGQCAFIGSTGHRCTSRHQLQLHHLHPFALGGPPLAGEPLPSLQGPQPPRCRTGLRPRAHRRQGRRPAGARSFRSDAPAPPGPVLGLRAPTERRSDTSRLRSKA